MSTEADLVAACYRLLEAADAKKALPRSSDYVEFVRAAQACDRQLQVVLKLTRQLSAENQRVPREGK